MRKGGEVGRVVPARNESEDMEAYLERLIRLQEVLLRARAATAQRTDTGIQGIDLGGYSSGFNSSQSEWEGDRIVIDDPAGGPVRHCGCYGRHVCNKCAGVGDDGSIYYSFGHDISAQDTADMPAIEVKRCTANPSCGLEDVVCSVCKAKNCPSAAKCWGCQREMKG